MIKVVLKDGLIKEFENVIFVMDVVKFISEGLVRNVVVVFVNGEVVGLDYIIDIDCDLNLFKFEDKEGKEVFRYILVYILV